MPTETFFNLKQDKRDRILKSAINEFSRYSYQKTNIANIAKQANISKGSMYQYFKDKQDLYIYLIHYGTQKKMEFLGNTLNNRLDHPFMDILRELYKQGVTFAIQHLELAKLFINFTKEQDLPFKNKLIEEGMEKSNRILADLLKKGKLKGEVNEGIDEQLTAVLLSQIDLYIVDTLLAELDHSNIKLKMDDYLSKVDKMLDLFEYGIKKRT
ncbi:TetR/AcrR family transcriptional regulator [Haloplasma contractile]|uniref:Transcriptional regulator TetR family protein n=1 Tax=Haloplasma contractile SSD-17B TaxID=1033810 RepID=U2FI56_9MOLU|nr:TetR/AcrR family transcriptional regulator [Haloplasma contractile]ERJ12495.1 Transcriptional regulator TetR family protein [Haloplasma contractile SSD-17B]